MKIKNLESDRKQRIETLRETIRGCEREIRRLEENPDTCEEGIPGDTGSVLLEQGVYEHMMQRIEDTLNWCHIDPFGNAVMDYETLYSNIDYCTLWRIYCCALDFGKRKNITRMEKSREV